MKTAVVIQKSNGHIESEPRQLFAEGLRRHGWNVVMSTTPAPCDLLVMWGTRRRDFIQQQKIAGGEVCILERGYVGDRYHWTSVSFGGGLNGRGVFRGPLEDASRWNRHFANLLQPWSEKTAGVALVTGQVPGDMSIKGMDINGFYRNALAAFKQLGYPVKFRPHPHGRPTARPIEDDLAQAAVVVTFNSNSGVVAGLAGVPVVAMDRGSMAWEIAGHEFKIPDKPDRTAWAHALAWKQWTREEIASGHCWAVIGEGL
jgi:hypothetical protein